MTFLVCPLCGKMTSLRNFDPSGFDLDVYQQDVVGLGRGKGFQVTAKYSILQSDTTRLIKGRLLDLLHLLLENHVVSRTEVERRLSLPDSDNEAKAAAALIEQKNRTIDELNEEVYALRASKEEQDDVIREIIQFVNDNLGSRFEVDENDEPLEALKRLVERMIDEVEALRASQEEMEIER